MKPDCLNGYLNENSVENFSLYSYLLVNARNLKVARAGNQYAVAAESYGRFTLGVWDSIESALMWHAKMIEARLA